MPRLLIVLLAGLLAVGSTASLAVEVVMLQSHPTATELRAACDEAGGTFIGNEDTEDYNCTVGNCDAQGGSCGITCEVHGGCWGTTPRLLASTALAPLLEHVRPAPPIELNSLASSGEEPEHRHRFR